MKLKILVSIFAVYFFYVSAEKSQRLQESIPKERIEEAPLSSLPTSLIRVMTLGQKDLYDDFSAIWLLQLLAIPDLSEQDVKPLAKAILKIIAHRPKLEAMYMLSCFVLAQDLNHPEYCEPITLHGLQVFPYSWRLPMTQGFIYAFKTNSPTKAAAFYQLAGSRKDSPPYVRSLARKLLLKAKPDSRDFAESLRIMSETPGGSKITKFLLERRKDKTIEDKNNAKE